MTQLKNTKLVPPVNEPPINDPGFLHEVVRVALQHFLEAEMTEHLDAAPHERTNHRRGEHHNGHKPRQLKTRVGTLSLLVPQDRTGTFRSELFERYQRTEKALVTTLMKTYLKSVSTRRVREVTEALRGTSFSKSTVSNLATSLNADLDAWRERRLDEVSYPYIIVNARYKHVRAGRRTVSQGALIVKGVRGDGLREILAVDVAASESESTYDALFRSLKKRGLNGVRMATSDDHRGLTNAIRRHFQSTPWQRRQAHFLNER